MFLLKGVRVLVLLLQIIAVFINTIIFGSTINRLKKNLRVTGIILLVFQAVFVLPIIFEWLFGIQDYSYKSPGFDKALNDTKTNLFYSIFAIVIPLVLYLLGRKNTGIALRDIKDSFLSLKVKREIYILIVMLMFVPLIVVLLSPSPEKYIFEYAYFQKYSDLANEIELWYHQNILRIAGIISLLSILIVKLLSKNTFFNNFLIYSAAIITGVLDGKRTLFAFIILGILLVDILKTKKRKIPLIKITFSIVLILLSFIGYAFAIDKHTFNVNTLDEIRLYFFRDVDVKFAIYALLNSEQYKILEFWGQSFLYNLTFYIPRTMWIEKPYPYDIYVTSASLNLLPGTVLPWSFQTSFFGEALANFGWFGLLISLVILYKFIQVSERTGNPIIILLCLFIIVRAFMNHFGSYSIFVVIWIFLMLINKFNMKRSIPAN